jgi:hypothetical protein
LSFGPATLHRLKPVPLDRAALTLCLHVMERANGHNEILVRSLR